MKIKKSEKEFYDAFQRRGLECEVASAVREVLNLEFLPESQPAGESWPERLKVYWSSGPVGGPVLERGDNGDRWLDISQSHLDLDERERLRELVARFNAIERWLKEAGTGTFLESCIQEEREKLRP